MKTPDGIDKPDEEARQEWRELFAPMERIGFECVGYDPDFAFIIPGIQHSHFRLPCVAIRRINAALESPKKPLDSPPRPV